MIKKFEIHKTIDIENNPFDRQERISWWSQDRLKNAKVMVVGAGAIGNETLKNLALLGIGNIFIVDFDTISTSNLSRTVLFRKEDVGKKKAEIAAQRVKELALIDDINVDWFHGDLVWELGTGIYQEMDIVLGCLDNIETRIAVNKHCWLVNTPWIDAGMQELALRVEFFKPPHLPCYRCSLTDQQFLNENKRYSCDFFKKKAFDAGKIPTTQIAAAMVSALQVQEAIKFLCGQEVSIGKKIYFQGTYNGFDIVSKSINENCIAHSSYPDIVSIPLSNQNSLKEFLLYVSHKKYSGEGATLNLGDRTFVHSIACKNCGNSISLMRPTFRIDESETVCNKCKETQSNNKQHLDTATTKKVQESFSFSDSTEEILNMSLYDLGIPYMQIVAVSDINNNYKYYKLNSDKSKILINFK